MRPMRLSREALRELSQLKSALERAYAAEGRQHDKPIAEHLRVTDDGERIGSPQGLRTILVQLSSLFLNISKPWGAWSSGSWWLMTKLGSISPLRIRSSSGRM